MSEPYVDAVEWARAVRSEEPHDLRDLEDVLLWKHPENGARLRWDEHGSAGLYSVFVLVYGLAAVAPVVGPAVFSGATYRGILGDGGVDASSAFPVTAVAFAVGLVFLMGTLVQWWRDRRRSTAVVVLAVLAVACGVLTLVSAHGYAGEFRGDARAYLVPVWATTGAGVVVAVAHLLSPPGPRRVRLATKGLSEQSRSLLLEERAEALRVLSERGLLAGKDVATLHSRPLGELHTRAVRSE